MSQKKSALGRGLAALLPSAHNAGGGAAGANVGGTAGALPAGPANTSGYHLIPIDDVKPAHGQPRKRFEEVALESLRASISAAGVLQPIVVRRLDAAGKAEKGVSYEIIAGERRWRAARLAGLKELPVVVKDVADGEALTLALEENIQRQDLNPIEEAESMRRLLDEHGRTQEQLAERLGRDRSSIANALRLLKLPKEVQESVVLGEISAGHAKALLMLSGSADQIAIAQKIIDEGLSVRAVEALCRPQKAARENGDADKDKTKPAAGETAAQSTAAQRAVEEKLQRRLGTKVRLQHKADHSGAIVIDYYSLAELERLVDQLTGH